MNKFILENTSIKIYSIKNLEFRINSSKIEWANLHYQLLILWIGLFGFIGFLRKSKKTIFPVYHS